MSTTAIDSPTPSVSPSPSEVVDGIEQAAVELGQMLEAELARLLRAGAKGYQASGDVAAFDGLVAGWITFVDREVAVRLAATYDLGGRAAGPGGLSAAAEGPVPGMSEDALAWARESASRFHDFGRQARTVLPELLTEAIEEGWGPHTLAQHIQDRLGFNERSALTMARTELMAAFTNGDRAAAMSLPANEQPVEHVWYAVLDAATRPDHVVAHEQTVPFLAPFTVGGHSMLHPHVPGAPVEQTVNCRCVELYLYPGDQRPDGTVVEGDAFHVEPGQYRLPATMEELTTNLDKAREFREELMTGLQKTYEEALDGTGYHIANINVRGAYWSAEIRTAPTVLYPEGQVVGNFSRDISLRDGVWTVDHGLFTLDRTVQGQGLATRLNAAAFDYYRSIGVEQVTLHANIDVGGYAWARQGFDWDPWHPEDVDRIVQTMRHTTGVHENRLLHGNPDASDFFRWANGDIDVANEMLQQTLDDLDSLEEMLARGEMPTPFELSSVGHISGMTTWIGKEEMLGSSWWGILRL